MSGGDIERALVALRLRQAQVDALVAGGYPPGVYLRQILHAVGGARIQPA